EEDATSLTAMLGRLHEKTAKWLNRLDAAPRRSVWHNFWDTRLTYERSYRTRLNYVHQNPVKHRLVAVANQYPWCSAAWFERTATPAQVRTIYRFKIDQLEVEDDFWRSAVEPREASGVRPACWRFRATQRARKREQAPPTSCAGEPREA